MTKDKIVQLDDFKRKNPPSKKVEHFDRVTFSITEAGKKENRSVCIVPEGASKNSDELCETSPISRILLGKEEGEEFEDEIPRKVTVIIESISKSKRQSKTKVA